MSSDKQNNNDDQQGNIRKNEGKTRLQLIWLSVATAVLAALIFLPFVFASTETVDPELYLNDGLTPGQQLKIRVHASHHTEEDIKNLVHALTVEGKTWDEAHRVLTPTRFTQHFAHLSQQLATIFVASMTLTVALLFALIAKMILDEIIVLFDRMYMRIWFSALYFVLFLVVSSALIMTITHYLSFRTYDLRLF